MHRQKAYFYRPRVLVEKYTVCHMQNDFVMKIQSNNENIFDSRGYRYNVGIVILNERNEAFWGRRIKQNSWQFPQGGMHAGESTEQAMYRELYEETGLLPEHVTLIGVTKRWLQYRLPLRYRRNKRQGIIQCVGQKQKWFLLRLCVDESVIDLNRSGAPEFDFWRWVPYWQPVKDVVQFKSTVYRQALEELSDHVVSLKKDKPNFDKKTPSRQHKHIAYPKRRHKKER